MVFNAVSLFLPESLRSYFLSATHFVSITLTPSVVRVVVLTATGQQRLIESYFEEAIAHAEEEQEEAPWALAYRKALARIPAQSKIRFIVSARHIVCKELILPAMSLSKLKRIIPLEIEAALPFIRSEAFIDSIIIQQLSEKREVRLLTMSVKRDVIERIRTNCAASYEQVTAVIPNITGVYALFLELLKPATPGPHIVIAIDEETVTLLAYDGTYYKFLRTLMVDASMLHTTSSYHHIVELIRQTIQPLIAKEESSTTPFHPHFIICGLENADELGTLLTQSLLGTTYSVITIAQLIQAGFCASTTSIPARFLLGVVTAMPLAIYEDFTLDQDVYRTRTVTTIARNLLCAGCLMFTLGTIYLATRLIVARQLYASMHQSEQNALDILTQQSTLTKVSRIKGLAAANKEAATLLRREGDIWNSLTGPQRSAIVKVLAELSSSINRAELGLTLTHVTISTNTNKIVLEGSVKDYTALTRLEQALQKSAIFKKVPNLQDTNFNAAFAFDVTAPEGGA